MQLWPGCPYWFFTVSIFPNTLMLIFNFSSSLSHSKHWSLPEHTVFFSSHFDFMYTGGCLSEISLLVSNWKIVSSFLKTAKWQLILKKINILSFTDRINHSLSMFPQHSVHTFNIKLITMYYNDLCLTSCCSLDHEPFESSSSALFIVGLP